MIVCVCTKFSKQLSCTFLFLVQLYGRIPRSLGIYTKLVPRYLGGIATAVLNLVASAKSNSGIISYYRYRYRSRGHKTDWSGWGTERSARGIAQRFARQMAKFRRTGSCVRTAISKSFQSFRTPVPVSITD
jgi:hypothetical protein